MISDWLKQLQKTPLTGRISVLDISPYPHVICDAGSRQCRAERLCILTSTTHKRMLEEKESKKTSEIAVDSTETKRHKRKEWEDNKNNTVDWWSEEEKERNCSSRLIHTSDKKWRRQEAAGIIDTTPCLGCKIPYNESFVNWRQCRRCKNWACADCACMCAMQSFCCGNCK